MDFDEYIHNNYEYIREYYARMRRPYIKEAKVENGVHVITDAKWPVKSECDKSTLRKPYNPATYRLYSIGDHILPITGI